MQHWDCISAAAFRRDTRVQGCRDSLTGAGSGCAHPAPRGTRAPLSAQDGSDPACPAAGEARSVRGLSVPSDTVTRAAAPGPGRHRAAPSPAGAACHQPRRPVGTRRSLLPQGGGGASLSPPPADIHGARAWRPLTADLLARGRPPHPSLDTTPGGGSATVSIPRSTKLRHCLMKARAEASQRQPAGRGSEPAWKATSWAPAAGSSCLQGGQTWGLAQLLSHPDLRKP